MDLGGLATFDRLKSFLTMAPMLASPSKGETLLLFVAATPHTVSAALVVEREEEAHALKVQRLVYFISKVLFNSKARYPKV